MVNHHFGGPATWRLLQLNTFIWVQVTWHTLAARHGRKVALDLLEGSWSHCASILWISLEVATLCKCQVSGSLLGVLLQLFSCQGNCSIFQSHVQQYARFQLTISTCSMVLCMVSYHISLHIPGRNLPSCDNCRSKESSIQPTCIGWSSPRGSPSSIHTLARCEWTGSVFWGSVSNQASES